MLAQIDIYNLIYFQKYCDNKSNRCIFRKLDFKQYHCCLNQTLRNVLVMQQLTWVIGKKSPDSVPCRTKFLVVPINTTSPFPSATVLTGPNCSGICGHNRQTDKSDNLASVAVFKDIWSSKCILINIAKRRKETDEYTCLTFRSL